MASPDADNEKPLHRKNLKNQAKATDADAKYWYNISIRGKRPF